MTDGSPEIIGLRPAAAGAGRRIKTYDFKRPDKFSKDQIRTVAIMHETFARLAGTSLSAMLRCRAHLHVAAVDQLTYEEFIRSIPNPTILAVVSMEPLLGSAILEIDPAVTYAIIDRLFGGRGEDARLQRGATALEQSATAGLITRVLANLREAWAAVIDLRPSLRQIETNPQFAQVVPPAEMVILVTLDAGVGEAQGRMNFCLPYLTIEPIISRLSARYWYSAALTTVAKEAVAHRSDLDVSAEVYFEGAKVSLRELGRLKRGSLVSMPGFHQGRAFLRVGGRTLCELNVRPVRRKRPAVYDVASRPAAESLFELPRVAPGTTENQAPEPGMGDALRRLSSEIGESLAGVRSAIDALRQKQELMAEQLAFGTQAVPQAGPVEEHSRPFGSLVRADPSHLLALLQQEHPQTIALVLSYMEPQAASGLLQGLAPDLRPDVARRIACLDRLSPLVLNEVEKALDKQLSVRTSEDYTTAGGVEALVEILRIADRSTERLVVDSLEKSDLELAQEVKRRMFVFDDILRLDRTAAEAVLRRTDPDTLLRALKAAPENVRSLVWETVPRGDVDALKRRLEDLGPIRLHEVERAQATIVALILEMEEAGEIVVPHADEGPTVVQ